MKQDSFDEDDVRSQPSTLRFDHVLNPHESQLRPKTPSFRSTAEAEPLTSRTPYPPAPPPMRLFNGLTTTEETTSWNKKYWNKKSAANLVAPERDPPAPSPMDPEAGFIFVHHMRGFLGYL